MNSKTLIRYVVLAIFLSTAVACGDDNDSAQNAREGEGTVTVNIFGQDSIEQGISADAMDDTTKTFDLTFDERSHYTECETTAEVKDGEDATFEITISASHVDGTGRCHTHTHAA